MHVIHCAAAYMTPSAINLRSDPEALVVFMVLCTTGQTYMDAQAINVEYIITSVSSQTNNLII